MTKLEKKLMDVGPGGIKCPCCADKPGSLARRKMVRSARKKAENFLMQEGIEDVESISTSECSKWEQECSTPCFGKVLCSSCGVDICPKVEKTGLCIICHERGEYEERKRQEKLNLLDTYEVRLETKGQPPTTWVRQETKVLNEAFSKTSVVIATRVPTEEKAEFIATNAKWKEYHKRGVDIDYNETTEMWECHMGGELIASAVKVCLICKEYNGCDYHEGSCSILS